MPIKVEIDTTSPAFPSSTDPAAYFSAALEVLKQAEKAIYVFSSYRADSTTPLTVAGVPCGKVEITK